jgi:hypothetical protein
MFCPRNSNGRDFEPSAIVVTSAIVPRNPTAAGWYTSLPTV